ncbi:DUF397 domain-containing protein [Streptomyces cyaneochromogenes]|uniref:DUF397 domain-containing protein n=1 Tax=Streptomyces cyaneochromogenes TaxID=2496836 RepID=A0A3Q9ENJ7_9ACTN|nr:DUF397 domain-containing protein [Streptomyces cyaneochromogenes]AZQ35561.1 DUF397 domain-containing protein [Streptomyces cyaneochromogenes]
MSADLHWFKSSYSGDQGECVEVALTPTTIHLRDSKTPKDHEQKAVQITPITWTTFLNSLL